MIAYKWKEAPFCEIGPNRDTHLSSQHRRRDLATAARLFFRVSFLQGAWRKTVLNGQRGVSNIGKRVDTKFEISLGLPAFAGTTEFNGNPMLGCVFVEGIWRLYGRRKILYNPAGQILEAA